MRIICGILKSNLSKEYNFIFAFYSIISINMSLKAFSYKLIHI